MAALYAWKEENIFVPLRTDLHLLSEWLKASELSVLGKMPVFVYN